MVGQSHRIPPEVGKKTNELNYLLLLLLWLKNWTDSKDITAYWNLSAQNFCKSRTLSLWDTCKSLTFYAVGTKNMP